VFSFVIVRSGPGSTLQKQPKLAPGASLDPSRPIDIFRRKAN
jgi:hypothetical protein